MAHCILAEIPFRTGYSLCRWREATNVMILKEEGNHRLEKLRTIVCYEADMNHNSKFLGNQMMRHTVGNGSIAQEQFSVPGKKCVDHTLNRRIVFYLSRYMKYSVAMTSCDLKRCYDRVAHTPAVLAMLGFGVPETPLYSMFHAIQNM